MPPTTPVTTDPRTARLKKILIGAIVLSGCVSLFIYISDSRLFGRSAAASTILFQKAQSPLSEAIIFNTRTGTVHTSTAEGVGVSTIVGQGATNTTRYYLITTPGVPGSNVFAQEILNAKIGLRQITNSANDKYDISVDSLSGTLAYTIIAQDVPRIAVIRAGTTTQRVIAEGEHPQLLGGGFFVVYSSDGKVFSASVDSREVHELLALQPGGMFAVDAANKKIALYAPEQSAIQIYDAETQTSVSYLSSIPVTEPVIGLQFVKGTPVALLWNAKTHTAAMQEGSSTPVSIATYPESVITGGYDAIFSYE